MGDDELGTRIRGEDEDADADADTEADAWIRGRIVGGTGAATGAGKAGGND